MDRIRPAWLDMALCAFALTIVSCSNDDDTATPNRTGPRDAGTDSPTTDSNVGTCQPRSCAQLAAQCGKAADGCGNVLDCGTCPTGKYCGGSGPNRCGDNPCTPATCSSLGASCGNPSDGCSQVLTCGSCSAPDTCGGGGTAYQCGRGCQPQTCADLNAECGTVDNGCGTAISCGDCPSYQQCSLIQINRCADACGQLDQPCCPTDTCYEGYCYAAACYPKPQLVDEIADGPGCADLGISHADYLWRYTIIGRPNALASRYCQHVSCSTPVLNTETDVPLDSTGHWSAQVANTASTDCEDPLLGAWTCWVVVDGQTSATSSGTYFNGQCAEVETCQMASSFCPPNPL